MYVNTRKCVSDLDVASGPISGAAAGMMGIKDTSGGQCVVGQPEETGATLST